jgi:hypothetical protein
MEENRNMRKLAIIGTLIGGLAALSAIGASMATAALPEFSNTTATFTSSSGSGTLTSKSDNTITCTADTDKGKVTGAKTVEVTVDFTGCTVFGIANGNSLGDAAGTILTTATGELCYLNKTEKKVGLLLTPTGELHLEAAGALAEVTGKLIGELKPVNTSSVHGELVLKAKAAGEQGILNCEDGQDEHLEISLNEGIFEDASEATTDKVTYSAAEELRA